MSNEKNTSGSNCYTTANLQWLTSIIKDVNKYTNRMSLIHICGNRNNLVILYSKDKSPHSRWMDIIFVISDTIALEDMVFFAVNIIQYGFIHTNGNTCWGAPSIIGRCFNTEYSLSPNRKNRYRIPIFIVILAKCRKITWFNFLQDRLPIDTFHIFHRIAWP